MINVNNIIKYCNEDITLIENYEQAFIAEEMWDCHHRLETDLHLTRKQLIEKDLYFHRPACELIFLSKSDHNSLHHKNKKYSELALLHMSKGQTKRYENPEERKKQSERLKGKNKGEKSGRYKKAPWNKGMKKEDMETYRKQLGS